MFALLIKERNLHNLAKRKGRTEDGKRMGRERRGSPSISPSLCLPVTSLSSLPPRRRRRRRNRQTG